VSPVNDNSFQRQPQTKHLLVTYWQTEQEIAQ